MKIDIFKIWPKGGYVPLMGSNLVKWAKLDYFLLWYFFSAKNTITAFNFSIAAKSRKFILVKNDKSGDSRKLMP